MNTRYWLFPLLVLGLIAAAVAQQADDAREAAEPTPPVAASDDTATADEAETDEEESPATVVDLDDPDFADLDEQSYEEDDDGFVPTQEIPADEPIPFPTDI